MFLKVPWLICLITKQSGMQNELLLGHGKFGVIRTGMILGMKV